MRERDFAGRLAYGLGAEPEVQVAKSDIGHIELEGVEDVRGSRKPRASWDSFTYGIVINRREDGGPVKIGVGAKRGVWLEDEATGGGKLEHGAAFEGYVTFEVKIIGDIVGSSGFEGEICLRRVNNEVIEDHAWSVQNVHRELCDAGLVGFRHRGSGGVEA
jgi:hypothetical protein